MEVSKKLFYKFSCFLLRCRRQGCGRTCGAVLAVCSAYLSELIIIITLLILINNIINFILILIILIIILIIIIIGFFGFLK